MKLYYDLSFVRRPNKSLAPAHFFLSRVLCNNNMASNHQVLQTFNLLSFVAMEPHCL